MNIYDLKIEDRPRERLIKMGPSSLTDIELLAIILGSGTKEENVLELSTNILKKYSFNVMKELSYQELININGIKQAKACKLLACFEIAKRAINVNELNIILDNSKSIYNYIKNDFYLSSKEMISVVYLDIKLRVIKKDIYEGDSPHNINLPMKDIVKNAINYNASCIVIAHNHPSNDLTPSLTDMEQTYKLKNILDNIGIILLEHLIIGINGYYSFNDYGLLKDINE